MKGVWRWVHTGRLAEYFNWDEGEPDNRDGEDEGEPDNRDGKDEGEPDNRDGKDEKCAMTRTSGWHDVGCDLIYYFRNSIVFLTLHFLFETFISLDLNPTVVWSNFLRWL